MIAVLVQFMPVHRAPRDEVIRRFKESVPHFTNIPGLVRKYYTIGEDDACGGIYLFAHRTQAEAFFTAAWRDSMQARFGDRPSITYFDAPVIIENGTGAVLSDD